MISLEEIAYSNQASTIPNTFFKMASPKSLVPDADEPIVPLLNLLFCTVSSSSLFKKMLVALKKSTFSVT